MPKPPIDDVIEIEQLLASYAVGMTRDDIDTDPSISLAMQVAQLPDSHEKGGDIPSCRAVCRRVVPGR